MTFRLDEIVVLKCLGFTLLKSEQSAEDGSLEAKEAQEVLLVGRHLIQHGVSLRVECSDSQVVTLDDALKLRHHRIGVRLSVTPVVAEVVNIVGVAGAVHFYGLQESHKLFKVGLAIDANHI